MSSNTWTPPAVDSEARRATRRLWRAVEAQHIASTLRLVANVEEQLVLERILDQSKPVVPKDAADLHYVLATPFRAFERRGFKPAGAFLRTLWRPRPAAPHASCCGP